MVSVRSRMNRQLLKLAEGDQEQESLERSVEKAIIKGHILVGAENGWGKWVALALCLLLPLMVYEAVAFRTFLLLEAGSLWLWGVTVALCRRIEQSQTERRVYFDLPILLESIVLLVESGVSVYVALDEVTQDLERRQPRHPLLVYFSAVRARTVAGESLSVALRSVAATVPHPVVRHVLFHLDIAASEGGELRVALHRLADYAHEEWKLSVRARVKRLENASVVPVFIAVIGMVLTIAAVPLVPLLEVNTAVKPQTAQMPVVGLSVEPGGR